MRLRRCFSFLLSMIFHLFFRFINIAMKRNDIFITPILISSSRLIDCRLTIYDRWRLIFTMPDDWLDCFSPPPAADADDNDDAIVFNDWWRWHRHIFFIWQCHAISLHDYLPLTNICYFVAVRWLSCRHAATPPRINISLMPPIFTPSPNGLTDRCRSPSLSTTRSEWINHEWMNEWMNE